LVQRCDANLDPDLNFFLEANPDPASYLDRAKNTKFAAKKKLAFHDDDLKLASMILVVSLVSA
jgi:hypothetical protein